MRAYGKSRQQNANRNIPGTSRPCPCCVPNRGHFAGKEIKTRARQAAKTEIAAAHDDKEEK